MFLQSLGSLLIRYHDFFDMHWFCSIPFSQFFYLRHIRSDEANFDKGVSEMSTFFLNQVFPSTIINRALNWVRPISRTSTLTPSLPSCNSDRVPLFLTYHPTRIHIQKIIRHHFCHLQQDATTRHIFPSLPLSAFHRDHSLQDTLVHSSFTLDNTPNSPMAPSHVTGE
eukprot:g38618.t1